MVRLSSKQGVLMDAHQPVLTQEIITSLKDMKSFPRLVLDATFGRGGHTLALLREFDELTVHALDTDEEAIAYGNMKFKDEIQQGRLRLYHMNFVNVLKKFSKSSYDAVIVDLGVSSPQFDQPDRGFSFQSDGPLDMRMDFSQGLTAADIINSRTSKELIELFQSYGDIRRPQKVVSAILQARPIFTTYELSKIISSHSLRRGRIHSATQYFMALRIAVNNELEVLENSIYHFIELLRDQGRLHIISFHSLEDRIVKYTYRACDKKEGKVLTKKVIRTSREEIAKNPRARSAKLRIFERGTNEL